MRNLLTFILAIPFIIFADSDCQPSIWGPDDEIGAANMISNENTLEAVKLISLFSSKKKIKNLKYIKINSIY